MSKKNICAKKKLRYNISMVTTLQYIDLFAGCGGLSLGLHEAGFQGLFAIEKNASAFLTLKHNLIEKNLVLTEFVVLDEMRQN